MEFNLFQSSPIPKFPITGVWDTVADVPTGAPVLDGGVLVVKKDGGFYLPNDNTTELVLDLSGNLIFDLEGDFIYV